MIYGLPPLLGAGVFYGVGSYSATHPQINLGIARFARQILLWGGAVILGGLIGGIIFGLLTTTLGVLYPNETRSTELQIGALVCLILGATSAVAFRRRGTQMAGIIGLALIGGAVLGVLGTGLGELLRSVLGETALWRGLESASVGVIVVELAALVLGGAYVLLWGVVWLAGKLPYFGNVDIKLAFRNLSARKGRTASTLMGLVAGVAALSLITLTTSAVTSLLQEQIETSAGGNVFILANNAEASEAVKKRLQNRLEGVESFSQFNFYSARLVAVDGKAPAVDGFEFGDAADGNRNEFGQVEGREGIGLPIVTVDPTVNHLDYEMKDGRALLPSDVNARVMIIREPFPGSLLDQLGVKMGTRLTWMVSPPLGSDAPPTRITYTVIGVVDRDSEQGFGDNLQAPIGSLPESVRPTFIVTVADIQEENIDAALIEFGQIADVVAIDARFIVKLIQQLIDQLIAIPTLVAVLSLLAGIAIIANTVALDTQERRRQIGVLKAVGLKGWRVLAQMMFENALIGLLAGIIGVGIGLLATIIFGVLGEASQVSRTLSLEPALALIAISVGVSLVATLISAWTAAREKPMNVLRYE
jgi:ABC-type antimicrobial peptide transport system permease subunit